MDTFGKSDPFVRVYVLPGPHDELKTKVIKKNLNPVYNESFQFSVSWSHTYHFQKYAVKVPLADVMKKTVVFQVFDWVKLTKTDGIGEVQIPLWQLNLASETNEWKSLHKITGTQGKVGISRIYVVYKS